MHESIISSLVRSLLETKTKATENGYYNVGPKRNVNVGS